MLDPIVDLSFATHSKPDPRAYRQAIEAMGEPAEDIVFVDDRRENVEGGRRAGLVSVWFDVTDPAGSYERVRAALDGRNP